ncbi:MAG: hypothetical protein Fur0037_11410 [Planctomycetota bacterium]
MRTWLLLDFFEDSRVRGRPGSSLTTAIFAQSFLSLAFAALLYPETPGVPFAAANLTLSSLLIGLGQLSDLRRSRLLADRVLLATAPISSSSVLAARVLHEGFQIGLLTAGSALPPAILLGWLARDVSVVPLYVAMACVCSGLVAGAITVVLRACSSRLGAHRAALLVGTTKALILSLGFVGFALALRHLDEGPDAMPLGRTGVSLVPTWHAARFALAPIADLAHGAILLGAAVVLWILAALIGEREAVATERIAKSGILSGLLDRLSRGGPMLGWSRFVAAMIYRSPGFRARVLPLIGVPAAMTWLALDSVPSSARANELFLAIAMQFPAIYMPFLIAFLGRADDPGASWVMEQSPGADLALARRASLHALATHVLLPVLLLSALAMILAGIGAGYALSLFGFSLGIGIAAARLQVQGLERFPFTSDEDERLRIESPFASAFGLSILAAGFALLAPRIRGVLGICALACGILLLRVPAVRPEGKAKPAPGGGAERSDRARSPEPRAESLGPELLSILVLCAAVSVLPFLIGMAFAP